MSSERKWIPFHAQLPTEADTDWRGWIMVSGPIGITAMILHKAISGERSGVYTHWTQTGLPKPPEPVRLGEWVKYVGKDDNEFGLYKGAVLQVRHIESLGGGYDIWTFPTEAMKDTYPEGFRFEPRDLAPAEKPSHAT